MCDAPTPCECTLEQRAKIRAAHIARSEALEALAHRLTREGAITKDETDLLIREAQLEWDDAIHIAAPDDPLRSLCGHFGRNLCDLPERPDPWAGCWMCLQRADELQPKQAEELVTA